MARLSPTDADANPSEAKGKKGKYSQPNESEKKRCHIRNSDSNAMLADPIHCYYVVIMHRVIVIAIIMIGTILHSHLMFIVYVC
jgi:hypothetical protein